MMTYLECVTTLAPILTSFTRKVVRVQPRIDRRSANCRSAFARLSAVWWSHRDKWDQIGDFGPMVMPLDEALAYVAEAPMGCFWH
jgi:hypothetical protein